MATRKQKQDVLSDVLNDSLDSFQQLNRIHFLVGEIEEENIDRAIRWIVTENLKSEEKVLTLYINSEGGSLTNAFALIDIMRMSRLKIETIGVGAVMSAAFLIFVAGTKGMRYIGKNASIMSHQFSDEVTGKYHDIKASMIEQDHTNNRMIDVILNASDKLDYKTVKSKFLATSDIYFTAEQLVRYGVADRVI